MRQAIRLIFVDAQRQQAHFDLTDTTITPCQLLDSPMSTLTAMPSESMRVLVLPAAVALPFQIDLPFSDPAKIARVLPQFVADTYVDVNENWLFSWQLLPSEGDATGWKIAGLAFPPEFAPGAIMPAADFRLAIPDVLLAGALPGHAYRVKTPVSAALAVFSDQYTVKRLYSSDSGLPLEMLLASENIAVLEEIDLLADPASLHSRITALMDCGADRLDLSGYLHGRKQQLQKLGFSIAGTLFVSWLLLWHLFILFECRIIEGAAQRTRGYMHQAFAAAFPGVPAVEPLTQTTRSIAEIEKRLKEAAVVPKIPWQPLFATLAGGAGQDSFSVRLIARENAFRLSGIARNYAALEALRGRLENCPVLEKVNTSESRQGEGGINFTLEGQWKP